MKNSILCCGNVAYDLIVVEKNENGEFIFSAKPGGSVLNTAVLSARLGLETFILAKTGEDFLSESLMELMQNEDIRTEGMILEKNVKTALALCQIDKKGNSTYVFYRCENKNAAINPKDLDLRLLERSSVFHTGSAFTYSDYTFKSALSVTRKAKKNKCFITYDPNWREGRIRNRKKAITRIKKFLALCSLLKLSDSDALAITGKKTLSRSIRSLPERSVITLGEKGSIFWNGKKEIFCPSVKTNVVDTIGAGDAFTAGLIQRYIKLGRQGFWEKMPENLKFASAASSLVCGSSGAISAVKNLKEVEDLANRP